LRLHKKNETNLAALKIGFCRALTSADIMESKTGKISLLIERHWINQCSGENKSLRWGNKGRNAIGGSVPA